MAIAIPIFTSQLEKSRDAVTVSNLRAAYAQAAADVLTSTNNAGALTPDADGNVAGYTSAAFTVTCKGTTGDLSGLHSELPFTLTTDQVNTLGAANGDKSVTFTFKGDTKDKVTITIAT